MAGLAAASTVVRVLRVVVMPALAMLTVCCSMTLHNTKVTSAHVACNPGHVMPLLQMLAYGAAMPLLMPFAECDDKIQQNETRNRAQTS